VTTNRADPTSRFSNRVADVGAGTGIFSAMVLEISSHVIGVEPNQRMREAAQEHIGRHSRHCSVRMRSTAR